MGNFKTIVSGLNMLSWRSNNAMKMMPLANCEVTESYCEDFYVNC